MSMFSSAGCAAALPGMWRLGVAGVRSLSNIDVAYIKHPFIVSIHTKCEIASVNQACSFSFTDDTGQISEIGLATVDKAYKLGPTSWNP